MKTISLNDRIESSMGVKFISAEWWDEASRFVVVRVSYLGDERTFRMDLFKRAFLDHLPEGDVEDFFQQSVEPIAQLVGQERGWEKWSSSAHPT